jgi:hypothetical protein
MVSRSGPLCSASSNSSLGLEHVTHLLRAVWRRANSPPLTDLQHRTRALFADTHPPAVRFSHMNIAADERARNDLHVDRSRTVHISRTIMLAEATALFDALPDSADITAYRTSVIEDNVLLKRTGVNREKTYRYLKQLYGLDPRDILYRAFRMLWNADTDGRPVLAALNAAYRDEVFRPTCAAILAARLDEPVGNSKFAATVQTAYPSRFSAKSLIAIGQHAASSWAQSGHLRGVQNKRRAKQKASVGPATLALLLGWMDGQRGLGLFETIWANLVTNSLSDLDALAFAASNRDWLRYKRLGDVVEIDFSPFLIGLEDSLG